MPFVINGIGTWYYGKRNVHRLRNVCTRCGTPGDLESYDTSLYFVVVFVPLVPLAHKRILDSCPACSRHRAVPLKEWQRAKDEAVAGVLDRLRADPNDRDTVLAALGVAASFQDEQLFDKLSDSLAVDRTDDAAIQAALGDCNGYFARHDEAVVAFQHSLRAEDSPRVREQLGLSLLRLGGPEQAAGCFRHVLEEKDEDRLWLLYQLTTAYQAKGQHAEALELLDRVNERFPDTAGEKGWAKLRKLSEKDRGRGRPVGKSALLEGRKAGTREGSRVGFLLPKLILPLLLVGFAGWHTWRSVALADARPVMLVNGSPKAYTVAVNGTPHQLAAGGTKLIEVPEGTVTLTPGAGAEGVEPAEVQFASTFWARPYDGTRVVLNPDRLAVLVREKSVYADVPPPPEPAQFFAGQPLHQLAGVNHFFEPFPGTVRAKKGQTVTRTRAGLVPIAGAESRAGAVAAAGLSAADQLEYGKRWLAVAPDDMLALAWFANLAPPATTLPVFRGRLADRPVRVEWHRVYQTVAERAGEPQDGLRAEYQKLAAEAGRDPDALYLLARVSDRAEAGALLREAVTSGKPAARAHYALGYRLLSEGDFAAAAAELEKAGPLARGPAYSAPAREALLATGRYRELLERLGEDGPRLPSLIERARVAELAGDPAEADAATNSALAQLSGFGVGGLRDLVQSSVTAARAAARGDVAGFLAAAPDGDGGSVAAAVLRGDLAAAEAAAGTAPPTDAALARGLVLLATPPGDAAKVAAAKQAFLAALGSGDREARELKRALEAGGADGSAAVREAVLSPADKRVYAAAAAVWFPAQKAELVALAHKLDYHRDAVSLALRKLTGGEAVKPAGKKPARPARR